MQPGKDNLQFMWYLITPVFFLLPSRLVFNGLFPKLTKTYHHVKRLTNYIAEWEAKNKLIRNNYKNMFFSRFAGI